MNVLITGGAGFIGQKVAHALLAEGKTSHIRIFDNFSPQVHQDASLPGYLTERCEIIKADIRDRDALKQALKGVDQIIHLAAETGTGQSMYALSHYFDVNVQGTALMLDILQNDDPAPDLRNIVVASSRAIYGQGAYRCASHGLVFPNDRTDELMRTGHFDPVCPVCASKALVLEKTGEDAPFKPLSFYGLTKQVQEQMILMFARAKGMGGIALRYQNVYGPGQSLKNPYTGILAVFSNLCKQNKPLNVFEDGLESRDFVYINDVVQSTILANDNPQQFVGSYNIGTGVGVDVLTLAQEVKNYFKADSDIKISGDYRIGDIRHNIANTHQFQRDFGFTPSIDFKFGLNSFLNWANAEPDVSPELYQQSILELEKAGILKKT